jgi:hypothetical protein
MIPATDRTYDYGFCPICFAQSPAVKRIQDAETGETYAISIATGKRATLEEATDIKTLFELSRARMIDSEKKEGDV